MKKYLFVGDVHNHSYIFDDIKRLDAEYNFDKIVFTGDYVDDWNTDNHNSLETLNTIFELKKSNKSKYIFLIGNHELSYLGYKCSGHQFELEDVVEMQLRDNIDLLDFYYDIDCNKTIYTCTHAGVTSSFIYEYLGGDGWKDTLKKINKDKLNNLDLLSKCSYWRGGQDECSSFLWADLKEHKLCASNDGMVEHQIVGHTPVQYITSEKGIIFIDTHSTYRSGEDYGDKSYLMWNGKEFEIIK